ncbi:MAG TPA: hypothetical protein VGL83_05610 [Stellaceae bacterium]|jgi:photosystem II stability/assembly factor-like uncharacterized protein
MTTACLAPNGMNVYRGAAASTRLLVGTAKGVALLERAPGQEWRHAGTMIADQHISSLLIEPVNGGTYAGVHRGGVFFSPDLGKRWEPRSAGISINHVYSLLSTIENGQPVLYAGTEPPAVFCSRDQGRGWEELPGWRDMPGKDKWVFPMPPHIPHAKSMAVDPRDPRVIYVGVEQAGLFKTTDGGRTWRELDSYSKPDDDSYRDVHQIVLRPNHPDELYMTTGMGLYRSTDGGETWGHLTYRNTFRIGYPDKLIFSPRDDRTMFICGSHANPGTWISRRTADAAVMVSHDAGESWSLASKGMPEPLTANLEAMCLYASPDGFDLFAGTTDGKVYFSDDGAASWRLIGSDLAPVSKVEHYRLLLPGAVSSRGNRPPGAGAGAPPAAH